MKTIHLGPILALALSVACGPVITDGTGGGGSRAGEVPDGLDAICASPLADVSADAPLDYLSIRRVDRDTDVPGEVRVMAESGEACSGAGDVDACLDALEALVPSDTGWGYCGEGCSDSALVWTRGDEVGLADSPDEVRALVGTVDSVGDAYVIALAEEYTPACETTRQLGGGEFRMEAEFLISDCNWTTENRIIEVGPDGALSDVRTLSVDESDGCAGRRPEGLSLGRRAGPSATARHLAHLAALEGAAVVAFERFALELEAFGAPGSLVERARAAARDEVRHAELMSGLARRAGAEPQAIEVCDPRGRGLLSFALENAVEGCVRETYGVADAAHRARYAPSAELRRVFGEIATDELRHAQLSWDVAAWAWERLSAEERAQVVTAMSVARAELQLELARGLPPEVCEGLGAPRPPVAQQLARTLGESLSASLPPPA